MVAALVPERISPPHPDPDHSYPRLVLVQSATGAARRRSPAVYRRRRRAALLVGLAVLGGLWAVGRAALDRSAAGLPMSRPAASRVWIVRPGDTLWAIALASGTRGDIRPLVDKLSVEVHGQPLLVGERITLP